MNLISMMLDHGTIVHKYLDKIFSIGVYLYKMRSLWKEKDGSGWKKPKINNIFIKECLIFEDDCYNNYWDYHIFIQFMLLAFLIITQINSL